MEDAPAADSSADAKEADPVTKYHVWGGLPATVAALEDFESSRSTDSWIASIFDKLDALASGIVCANTLHAEMTKAEFTLEDVNRINSPLLDGLWIAVTGRQGSLRQPCIGCGPSRCFAMT